MEETLFQVYLVDDEPAIVRWLMKNVRWEDFGCTVAGQGCHAAEALEFMRSSRVDLLITDVCMPDMDGLELIRRAKEALPALRMVIISAFSNFAYVKSAMRLGAENYLLKPLDLQELEETLQKTAADMEKEVQTTREGDIRVFRNNLLQRWAENEIREGSFAEQAELAQLDWEAASYAVLSLQADRREPAALLELFAWCNGLRPQWDGYFFVDHQSRIVGILPGYGEKDRSFLLRAAGDLRERISPSCRLSLGCVVEDYRKVPLSCETSLEYLNAAGLLQEGMVFGGDFPGTEYAASLAGNTVRLLDRALREDALPDACRLAGERLRQAADVRREAVALAVHIASVTGGSLLDGGELASHAARFPELSQEAAYTAWTEALIHLALHSSSAAVLHYHPYVSQAVARLKKEFSCVDLSLQVIADSFGVSPAYMGQLFHSQTGKYFNDYLTELRLDAACILICDTRLKIREITEQVGLSSQSYFNRVFRKKYGQSPLEYRHHLRTQESG